MGPKGFTAPLFFHLQSQQHLGVTCPPSAHRWDALLVQKAQRSGPIRLSHWRLGPKPHLQQDEPVTQGLLGHRGTASSLGDFDPLVWQRHKANEWFLIKEGFFPGTFRHHLFPSHVWGLFPFWHIMDTSPV